MRNSYDDKTQLFIFCLYVKSIPKEYNKVSRYYVYYFIPQIISYTFYISTSNNFLHFLIFLLISFKVNKKDDTEVDHFYWLWSIRRWNPQIIVTNRSVTKSQFIAQICSRMQRGCTDVINNICANCKDTWGTLLHRTPVRCHTHSQTILLANHASKLCSVTIMRIYACTTIFRLPMFVQL